MGLNAKQKEAVEYLDGPLLVLAGPGTGKTHLLSDKVKYILENTDTNPENVLCVTFTESGASNMRERLKSKIGPAANKIKIGTYHAIGGDILAQYKNYSENYDRRLDSSIDEVLQYKIIKNLQNQLPLTDILRGDNIKDILDTISSAKSANLSADDLAKIAETNIADSQALGRAISPLLLQLVDRKVQENLDNVYQPIYDIISPYIEMPPILKTIDRSIKTLAIDLKKAIDETISENSIKYLTAWRNKYFEKDDKGGYRFADQVANKKLASLANVMRAYDDYLNKQGLYDFDDMIEEAVKILKKDNGFRLNLSEKYQYILLDEFQDTNPSQFEIIKQITDYEKPIIMAVGDDDQAIYEFQGASATVLSDFQAHYGAHTIALTENYRSTQEILDFAQQVIAQADNRFVGEKLLTAHKDDPASSEIFREEFASSDAEYFWIANKVAELIKSGVSQSEIAIISQKTKYFTPLLPFLKSHAEINIAYDKKDDLLQNPELGEIFTIARFVHEIANRKPSTISILEIMAMPFWEVSVLSVIKATNRARGDRRSDLELLAESDDERLTRIADFFANLVAASYESPLEIIIDYIIGNSELKGFRSPFLKYYENKGYSTFELYENLATLRGKINHYFVDQAPKLANLIDLLDDYLSAGMPISSTSPYRDANDAVQVMTAHKSKGLEFEYVFIISTDNMAWGKGKGNNNLLALPKNLTQIRHTGTTDGERLRVLYVALTRAKKSLFITNSRKDFNEKSPERLSYLEEYVDENEKIVSPFLPEKFVGKHYEEDFIDKTNTDLRLNWVDVYRNNSPDMRLLYQGQVENYILSPSDLTSFIDIVYAGPAEFFKNKILHMPPSPMTAQIAFGNLMHACFQRVTTEHISDDEALEFFFEELQKQPLLPEDINSIRESAPEALKKSLAKFGKILRAPGSKAELNLYSERLVVNGVPITGIIDHINIDESNKTIEIYDFKTGEYKDEKWDASATLYKYALQLGFYKLLLNASPTYAKYKISRAHILFVKPDRHDSEVHDKVFEFDDAFEQKLLALCAAVYAQIKSLNFLDDPELYLGPNNQLKIKDIKEFCDLVIAK